MGACIARDEEEGPEGIRLKEELLRTQTALLQISEKILLELQRRDAPKTPRKVCTDCKQRSVCMVDASHRDVLAEFDDDQSTPSIVSPCSEVWNQTPSFSGCGGHPHRPDAPELAAKKLVEALPAMLQEAGERDRRQVARAVQLTSELTRTNSLCTRCAYFRIYSQTPRRAPHDRLRGPCEDRSPRSFGDFHANAVPPPPMAVDQPRRIRGYLNSPRRSSKASTIDPQGFESFCDEELEVETRPASR